MSDLMIGRQPIYDRRLNVVGYELLHRAADPDRAIITDGNRATSELILNTFVEIGLERIVGHGLAFINLTRDFALRGLPLSLPPDRVVLELLETAPVDDELIDAMMGLAAAGYTIALDDFVYDDVRKPLLDAARIVKLDVLALGHDAVVENVRHLRNHGVQLVAEKVETPEDYAFCRDLGFDFFQGFFFCKPDLVRGRRTPNNRLGVLLLLAKLQNAETDFSELEALITQDVALSYKLLRLINSAYYARPTRVESIRQALILLGTKMVTTWVSLIIMAGIDGKPSELVTTAMVRARMCEMLARAMRVPNKDAYFTVGLFSVLDALLDTPMAEVVRALPLSEEVSQALLHFAGPIGGTLRSVLAYEQADWDRVQLDSVEPHVFAAAYLDAIAWAHEIRSALAA